MVSSHLSWTVGAYKSLLSFGAEDASLLMQTWDWSSVVCMTHWILEPPHHYPQFHLVSPNLPVTSLSTSYVSLRRIWPSCRTLNQDAYFQRIIRCLEYTNIWYIISGIYNTQCPTAKCFCWNTGVQSTARKRGKSHWPASEWRLSCQCHFLQALQWFGSL